MKNIVYTYYENISTINEDNIRLSSQHNLIELCRQSWKANGWDLIVLDYKFAKKHPYYNEYSSIIKALPSINPESYDYHCYMRWLAMVVVGGGLMIDYDVINYNSSPNDLYYHTFDIDGKLTILQHSTPSGVYGTSEQYLDICKKFTILKDNHECYDMIQNKLHTSDMIMIAKGIDSKSVNKTHYINSYPIIKKLIHCSQSMYDKYGKTKYEMMREILENKQNIIEDEYSFNNIDQIIDKNKETFDKFDYKFYLYQYPSIAQKISLLPSEWDIKIKFFYDYITRPSKQKEHIHLTQHDYDTSVLKELSIDPDFDEKFYAQKYPETSEYYNFSDSLLSDKARLYHHYINYKDNNTSQYYYKNKKEWSKYFLNLSIEIPESFDADLYSKLYHQANDYFFDDAPVLDHPYRMYHHYLSYGKQDGYSCNHDTVPIFYHIPKCGGTSIHYGLMIPSLFHQYSNMKKLFNLNFIDSSNNKNIFSIICYIYTDAEFEQLFPLLTTNVIGNNSNGYDANIPYESDTLTMIKNHFNILALVINPAGFPEAEQYIDSIITKKYETYIILRQSLSWHQSFFYYLRDIGTWEHTSHVFDKNMSFADYIHSDSFTDSWLIRNLVHTDKEITEKEYELCKNKLEKFTHIGFLEKFKDTQDILSQKYNWCVEPKDANKKHNSNSMSKYEGIGPLELYKLNQQTVYDNKLYEYFYQKTYGNK